jgi:hypothetical protein
MTSGRPRLGPICWAQHWLWLLDSQPDRPAAAPLLLRIRIRVPAGLHLSAFREALGRLVANNEALRTLYRIGDDGLPQQIVQPSAEPAIIVADSAPEARDLDAYTPAIDITRGSAACAVVRLEGDVVTAAVLVVHAVVVDGYAMTLLRKEFEAILSGTPAVVERRWQPLDQALAESSQQWRQVNDRAMEHWKRGLAVGPHACLPFYWQSPPESVSLKTTLSSKILAGHGELAAAKYETTLPALLQTLLAVLLCGWTGHLTCAIDSIFTNRWPRRMSTSVGRYAGGGRVPFDLRGLPTFSLLARRSLASLVTSYRHGKYDVGEVTMMESREAARIGACFASAVLFEYHDYTKSAASRRVEEPRIHQTPLDYRVANLLVDVFPSDGDLSISLRAPTEVLPGPAARRFLDQLRGLLSVVAEEPDPSLSELLASVDVPAPWKGPGWVAIRDSWIKLEDVAHLLRDHPLVSAAAVFPIPSGRLHAHVATATAGLSIEELDGHMRAGVSHYPTTMLPHVYTIHASAPEASHDAAAWERQPRLAAGPAVRATRKEPEGAEETFLATTISGFNPELTVDMSASYAELGGAFLKVPAILTQVKRAGYTGIAFGDLVGTAPLTQVAAKLVRSRTAT